MFRNSFTVNLGFLPNCGFNIKMSLKIKAKLFEEKKNSFLLLGIRKTLSLGEFDES